MTFKLRIYSPDKIPFCLYFLMYLLNKFLCLSDKSTSFPLINAISTLERISKISPSEIKSVASFPTSNDPIISETPKISAVDSVIALIASSLFNPNDTAIAA